MWGRVLLGLFEGLWVGKGCFGVVARMDKGWGLGVGPGMGVLHALWLGIAVLVDSTVLARCPLPVAHYLTYCSYLP